jgi:proteasome accessory factor B
MQKVIERILNLLAYLLTVDRPVTADEIRHTVAGYDRERDAAFHRTFERDKDLLRRLGIPIEREATDVFEVEFGYVVHDDRYALEDPGLTDEERTALALAVQAVGFGGRPSGQEALMKLGGAVGSLDGTELGADLGEQAETVAAAFAAISERRTLSFGYRGRDRRVRPYGLVHRRGHWYLVAADIDGEDVKVYRLDRTTALVAGDRAGTFTPPDGFTPADAVLHHPWDAGPDAATASVVFDEEVAWIAERELGPNTAIERGSDGSITATIEIAEPAAFLGWLVGFEDHAEIMGPPELRTRYLSLVDGS